MKNPPKQKRAGRKKNMTPFKKHTHRKQRPFKDNEKAGMADLLAKIRELREQAVKTTTQDRLKCPVEDER